MEFKRRGKKSYLDLSNYDLILASLKQFLYVLKFTVLVTCLDTLILIFSRALFFCVYLKQNVILQNENQALKKNISALIKTARVEINRKDEEISNLHQRYNWIVELKTCVLSDHVYILVRNFCGYFKLYLFFCLAIYQIVNYLIAFFFFFFNH